MKIRIDCTIFNCITWNCSENHLFPLLLGTPWNPPKELRGSAGPTLRSTVVEKKEKIITL